MHQSFKVKNIQVLFSSINESFMKKYLKKGYLNKTMNTVNII